MAGLPTCLHFPLPSGIKSHAGKLAHLTHSLKERIICLDGVTKLRDIISDLFLYVQDHGDIYIIYKYKYIRRGEYYPFSNTTARIATQVRTPYTYRF